jgi:hypothetical protein
MRPVTPTRPRHDGWRQLGVIVVCLGIYAVLTMALYRRFVGRPRHARSASTTHAAAPASRRVEIRDGRFTVGGVPFLVKAVGWDPVRPGELPGERRLDLEELDGDLARITAAGFNTVRTRAPLGPDELELVARHHLHVLEGLGVPSDGDLLDASQRRDTLARVARAVRATRSSPAILGYLVWTEPRARAVAHAGLGPSTAYLGELVATVRALDPTAPIGYASVPGMEALDDELLDFIAFDLDPRRPQAIMDVDGLGGAGYLRLLRETVARGRPLIISGSGISVSPEWSGWWKNDATPDDALGRWPRAVVVAPRDGDLVDDEVRVRVVADAAVELRVTVDAQAPAPLPLSPVDGGLEATLAAPPGPGPHQLQLELRDAAGATVARETRLVRRGPPRPVALEVSPRAQQVPPGAPFSVAVDGRGLPADGLPLRVITYTADDCDEQSVHTHLDADGRARIDLVAPAEPTLLTVVAFEDDAQVASVERAAAWAAIEVRP